MCEIPSNVILADEFHKMVDGISFGTNDLTSLILGLDRDGEKVNIFLMKKKSCRQEND